MSYCKAKTLFYHFPNTGSSFRSDFIAKDKTTITHYHCYHENRADELMKMYNSSSCLSNSDHIRNVT